MVSWHILPATAKWEGASYSIGIVVVNYAKPSRGQQ